MADTSMADAAPPMPQRQKKSDWRVGKIRNKRLTVLRKAHAFHKCSGARVYVTIFYKHKWFVYSSGRKPNPLAPPRPEWPPPLRNIRADFECEPEIWHAEDLENVSPGRQFVKNPKKPVGTLPPPPLPQPAEPVPDHRRDVWQEQPQDWLEEAGHSPDMWSQDGEELSDEQITDAEDDVSSVDSWRYWVNDGAFTAPAGVPYGRDEDVAAQVPNARSSPMAYDAEHNPRQLAILEAHHHATPGAQPQSNHPACASEPDESSYPSPPRTEGSAHTSTRRKPRFDAARDMLEDSPPACSPMPSTAHSLQTSGPDCTEEDIVDNQPCADPPNTPVALHIPEGRVADTAENVVDATGVLSSTTGQVRRRRAAPRSEPRRLRPRAGATPARGPRDTAVGSHEKYKHVDFFIPIRATRSNTHLPEVPKGNKVRRQRKARRHSGV